MSKEPIMLTPGTLRVSPKVLHASVRQLQHRSPEVETAFLTIRKNLRSLLELYNDQALVMFPTTGRGGLEAVLNGIVPVKNVLVVANGRWSALMGQIAEGINPNTVRVLHLPTDEPISVPKVAEAMEQMLADGFNVDVLAFASHETERGLLNPTEDLLDFCKQSGLISLVDAMSSLIIDTAPINEADIFCFNACKGLRSLRDIAIVCIRDDIAEQLTSTGNYLNFVAEYQHQNLHTTPRNPFPVGPVLALAAATDELMDEGIEHRRAQIMENMQLVKDWAHKHNIIILTNPEYLGWCTLPMRFPDGWTYPKFRTLLLERGYDIYYSYAGPLGDTFEISTLGWLAHHEVLDFLRVASEIMELT